jgi:hypothetical protein
MKIELQIDKCVDCRKSFYFDEVVCRHPSCCPQCSRVRGSAFDTSRWIGRCRTGRQALELPAIRNEVKSVHRVLAPLISGIREDPRQVHVIFGPHGSGMTAPLDLGLLRSGLIRPNRQLCVVVPRPERISKYASITGNAYYGVAGPDQSGVRLCGPYLAVGYHRHHEPMFSRRNRIVYLSEGKLWQAIEYGALGQYGLVVLGDHNDCPSSYTRLLNDIMGALNSYPLLCLLIKSHRTNEDALLSALGGPSSVCIHLCSEEVQSLGNDQPSRKPLHGELDHEGRGALAMALEAQ